jgi:hypothetical protein
MIQQYNTVTILMFIASDTIVNSKAGEVTMFLLPNLPLRQVNVTYYHPLSE